MQANRTPYMTIVSWKNYLDVDRAQPGYLNSRSSRIRTIKQYTSKQMQRQVGGTSERQDFKQSGHGAAWLQAGSTSRGQNSWQARRTGRQDSRQAGHTERQDYRQVGRRWRQDSRQAGNLGVRLRRQDRQGGRTLGRLDI